MKRYKYFYRLAATLLLCLFLPVAVVASLSWSRCFKEIERSNETYYAKLLEYFASTTFNELKQQESNLSTISVESKRPTSAFWKGSSTFSSNPYWYYEAVNELRSLAAKYDMPDVCVYYYGLDRVITRNNCQTLQNYVANTPGVSNADPAFFAQDNYAPSTTLFATTNTEDSIDGQMLVGYCTKMGRSSDPVLIFFPVSVQNNDQLKSVVSLNSGIDFYIKSRDTGKILLSLQDSPASTSTTGVYTSDSGTFPLIYEIRVTSDSLRDSLTAFYSTMQFLWFTTIPFLLILTLLAIFLAYKPVRLLVKEMEPTEESGGSEFDIIRNSISEKNTKINEQADQMESLLVDHLVDGGHNSKHHLAELGINTEQTPYYCVYLIEGSTFLAGEMKQLSKAAQKFFGLQMFITETEDDTRRIAVAFLKEENSEAVRLWALQWLREQYSAEYTIKAGKVVTDLDEIRASFISCYRQNDGLADMNQVQKDLKSLEQKEERRKKQQEDILNYLEKHYADPDLSQLQVAEAFEMSTSTLSRLFKNQIGVGFSEYVNEKRIERAKDLLLTTSASTREIAEQVGLPNYNYFLRLFKSTVGVSPTVFRQNAKKAGEICETSDKGEPV